SRELEASGLPAPDLAALRRLSAIRGIAASRMPEDSLLVYQPPSSKPLVFSLIRNSAHTNVAEIFSEADRRLPEEDSLLTMTGIVGAYPNAIFAINRENAGQFADAVAALRSEADLARLTDAYGIRRTDPRFWPTSDAIHDYSRASRPIEFGILDYSRLENH
ncbi:MAG TPA: fatty acid cis/trans isomerase, partial [Azonexus sp.]|nr:fatty acid cis/trans isomerase [Azonexus sp.]